MASPSNKLHHCIVPPRCLLPPPCCSCLSWQILPLLLDPAALIIASFSWRQIVQPGAAPEGFHPLTNSLLIFCQKGMERGGGQRGERERGGWSGGCTEERESIRHPSSSLLPRDHLHWLEVPGGSGVKKRRGWGEGEAGGDESMRGGHNVTLLKAMWNNCPRGR